MSFQELVLLQLNWYNSQGTKNINTIRPPVLHLHFTFLLSKAKHLQGLALFLTTCIKDVISHS